MDKKIVKQAVEGFRVFYCPFCGAKYRAERKWKAHYDPVTRALIEVEEWIELRLPPKGTCPHFAGIRLVGVAPYGVGGEWYDVFWKTDEEEGDGQDA